MLLRESRLTPIDPFCLCPLSSCQNPSPSFLPPSPPPALLHHSLTPLLPSFRSAICFPPPCFARKRRRFRRCVCSRLIPPALCGWTICWRLRMTNKGRSRRRLTVSVAIVTRAMLKIVCFYLVVGWGAGGGDSCCMLVSPMCISLD